MPTIPISYAQALAIGMGANYYTNHKFPGIVPPTLLSTVNTYQFVQPNEIGISNNLYNSQELNYALASSTTTSNIGLVYNKGGNLVDTAIKYTNGKSLGNWYEMQRHANVSTGGTITSQNGVLRITCGGTTNLVNRSLLHDTKFNRAGAEQLPTAPSTAGYLQETDTANATVYFKGYVEPFDFLAPTSFGTVAGKHTIFFVGYRYFHTQNEDEALSTPPLETFTGPSEGFGFQAIRNGNNFTWHCIVVALVSTRNGASGICFSVNTGLSAFGTHRLKVNYNNGTLTWYANETQVATTSFAALIAAGNDFTSINSMYACVASIKGGSSPEETTATIPGKFTICVNEAMVIRQLPLVYNNWEDTDTEVTLTETQYHNTGVQLLKKLK
jgi:hypothetical protein